MKLSRTALVTLLISVLVAPVAAGLQEKNALLHEHVEDNSYDVIARATFTHETSAEVVRSPGRAGAEAWTDHAENDTSTFAGRAQLLVEKIAAHGVEHGFWGEGKYGAYPAMAMFEAGHIEQGRTFAEAQLDGGGAMFREFGTMALYMQYRDLYGETLREKVKQNQLSSPLYDPNGRGNMPGASENHKLMYAAANYLGGLEWPEDYPQPWFEAGRDYLDYWFDEVTTIGFWEQDSPTYLIHHLGPIHAVAEHAPEDSEMKRKAEMVLEWYLASLAGEYLKGYWITASARDYVPVHGVELSEETAALMWLYFGNTEGSVPHPHPTEGHPPYIHWFGTLHMAVGDYQPPAILKRIATDRDEPYVHREFMYRNPMRPRQYSYVTPSYGIASFVHWTGDIPPDMTRWKVQWVPEAGAPEPSAFFMKHPNPGLEEAKWMLWRGASPHEQVLQHEGTLLAVYRIPEDDAHPFIDGPVHEPAYQAMFEEGGWHFFHSGSMLMAVRAAQGLHLTGDKRNAYDHYGETAKVNVLRSEGRRNALVVDTAPVADFAGGSASEELNRFAKAVLERAAVDGTELDREQPQLRYTSLSGDRLEIVFDGPKRVNGEELNFEDWPMLGNPWMHQTLRGRYLTLEHGGERRVYDFQQWRVETSGRP